MSGSGTRGETPYPVLRRLRGLADPPRRFAGGGMRPQPELIEGLHHASNMITLRTVLPAFMAAKPSLISDSFSLAEIQSSRCSRPRM
jgi:hypothetical protein